MKNITDKIIKSILDNEYDILTCFVNRGEEIGKLANCLYDTMGAKERYSREDFTNTILQLIKKGMQNYNNENYDQSFENENIGLFKMEKA